ncbi:unnamed protein product [Enterobius vermicularis]|uniref:HD_domain domain-containing protein n=1 Tax=Enterobius vermicularis TaxID=51028 RepID=A0A0N4UVN1_ENTVE|nr:unnamed protein product [Enterobius vermicularis]
MNDNWELLHCSRKFNILDVVYGSIPLYYPLNLIVDTPIFQRLRRLKQTSAVHFVYPGCEHSRFTHSLGFVYLITERQDLGIDSRDQLCVAIAGLFHDVGHGPFSHLFEEFLRTTNGDRSWTHEKESVLVFEEICKNKQLKEALDEYLEESDYTFIKEMINPPKSKFDQNGQWILKGRSLEKSYLYDIICNQNDSLDVDKYDYILRDAIFTSFGIPFNRSLLYDVFSKHVRRIMNWDKNGNECLQLCYAYKVLNELQNVGESRYLLHSKVYNHRTVCVCEYLIIKAFQAAAPHLIFKGDDGQDYNLTEVTSNLSAFLKCDDLIFQMVIF